MQEAPSGDPGVWGLTAVRCADMIGRWRPVGAMPVYAEPSVALLMVRR